MIKIRLTYVDNEKGAKELDKTLEVINREFEVINTSRVYKGRGESKFSNLYIDVENKE